jgi:hypothetical protein
VRGKEGKERREMRKAGGNEGGERRGKKRECAGDAVVVK